MFDVNKTFLDYIEREEWPFEMYTSQDILLHTTNLDDELNEKHGNYGDISPSLL